LGSVEWVIDLAVLPEVVQQDGQLSSDGDDGAFLGRLAAAFSELQPPAAQVAVRSERPKDVLGALDQEPAEIAIAGLGDVELRILGSALVSAGDQSQARAELAALAEAMGIFQGQDVGQGGDGADARDVAQEAGFGIVV